MKIKGTIGQYPIDLDIELDIDSSKINELISLISEKYKYKSEIDTAKALASVYKKQVSSTCSEENIRGAYSSISPMPWGYLK